MKRNVEIEDTLPDRVENAIELVCDQLIEYIKENKPDRTPDLHNDLDYSGSIHEIVDGCVPVYTKEIDDAWYLHKRDLVNAYENAGVGNNPTENDGMAAIYYYIHEQVCDWYRAEADEIYEDIMNGQEADND